LREGEEHAYGGDAGRQSLLHTSRDLSQEPVRLCHCLQDISKGACVSSAAQRRPHLPTDSIAPVWSRAPFCRLTDTAAQAPAAADCRCARTLAQMMTGTHTAAALEAYAAEAYAAAPSVDAPPAAAPPAAAPSAAAAASALRRQHAAVGHGWPADISRVTGSQARKGTEGRRILVKFCREKNILILPSTRPRGRGDPRDPWRSWMGTS